MNKIFKENISYEELQRGVEAFWGKRKKKKINYKLILKCVLCLVAGGALQYFLDLI